MWNLPKKPYKYHINGKTVSLWDQELDKDASQLLPLLLNILVVIVSAVKQEEIKAAEIGWEEIKLS